MKQGLYKHTKDDECFDREKIIIEVSETARSVLPTSLKTTIVMTANVREWRHFLKLRAVGTTGKPHPDIKVLADDLLEQFKEQIPILFDDIKYRVPAVFDDIKAGE